MNNWLVVRSIDDLAVALPQINRLLMTVWHEAVEPSLMQLEGVWIDPVMVSHAPTQLPASRDKSSATHLSIHEAVGLPGIWQLFRLHDPDNHSKLTPQDVFAALICQSKSAAPVGDQHLIPVLCSSSDFRTTSDDINRLIEIAQENNINVPTVWYQDSVSGQCQQPDTDVSH